MASSSRRRCIERNILRTLILNLVIRPCPNMQLFPGQGGLAFIVLSVQVSTMQCLANTLSECMITYAVFKSAAVYVLSARFPSPRQTHLTAMLTSLIGNHHSPDLTILGFAVAAIVVLRTSRTIYNRLNQLPFLLAQAMADIREHIGFSKST